MPFLKNMLLYYCMGTSPETARPLLRSPDKTDPQWEMQKKTVRAVNEFRNKILHQRGIGFTKKDLGDLKTTFALFVNEFFDSTGDSALLDKLRRKEEELENAKFLF